MTAPNEVPNVPLVLVCWEDAASDSGATLEAHEDFPTFQRWTIGVMKSNGRSKVTLAATYDDRDGPTFDTPTSIPTGCVLWIRELSATDKSYRPGGGMTPRKDRRKK